MSIGKFVQLNRAAALSASLLSLSVFGCTREKRDPAPARSEVVVKKTTDQFVVGGIYSTESGDGDFTVAKILALDDQAVHVRVYKNKYPTRPSSINVADLSLGSIKDPEGFGMGHLPLSRQGFIDWKPVLVTTSEVTKDELEGYEMWKESGGGVWP